MRDKVLSFFGKKGVRIIGYVLAFFVLLLIFLFLTFPARQAENVLNLYLNRTFSGKVKIEGLKVGFPLTVKAKSINYDSIISAENVKVKRRIFFPVLDVNCSLLKGNVHAVVRYKRPQSYHIIAKGLSLGLLPFDKYYGVKGDGTGNVEISLESTAKGEKFKGMVDVMVKSVSIKGGKVLNLFDIPPVNVGDIILKINFENSVGDVKVGRIEGGDVRGQVKGKVFLMNPLPKSVVNLYVTLKLGKEMEKQIKKSFQFLNLKNYMRGELKISISGPLTNLKVRTL